MNKRKLRSLARVVDELLVPNNTITTLEVKLEMRRRQPNSKWNQKDVSNMMDTLHSEGSLTYVNNGVHRIYSKVGAPANAPLVAKIKAKPKTTYISKIKALNVMLATNNHFFSVVFTKQDGSERKLVCRVRPNAAPDHLGYLNVIESKTGDYKHVNMQTLSEVRANGKIFKIR